MAPAPPRWRPAAALGALGSLWLATSGRPAAAYDSAAPPVHVHTTAVPVRIDGVLDEAAWSEAVAVTELRRHQPTAGPAPGDHTEIRVLQDAEALYFGITVRDTTYRPRAHIAPREDVNVDDQIGIYLDPIGDARTGYIFYFNALGIQQDIRYANGQWFPNWNTVIHSKGTVSDDGYTLEIALPFRSLRFPSQSDSASGTAEQTWGVIFTRKVPEWGSKFSHPHVDRSHPRTFEQASPLVGVRPPDRGAGIELIPVLAVVTGADRTGDSGALEWQPLDVGDSAFWTRTLRPGLDARYGLTSDTGLAATLNPDFSQIEGDATQIDLNQRFAFHYTERRPFFLDGLDAFDDGQNVLYTRSINDPVGGIKLSGKEGRTGLGGLVTIDRAPSASIHEHGTPGFDADDLTVSDGTAGSPATWAANSYARTRLDAFGTGYVGLTGADKRALGTNGGQGDGWNDVLGIDWLVPLGDTWTTNGFTSWSGAGDGSALLLGTHNKIGAWRSVSSGPGGWLSLEDSTADYRKEMGYLTQSGLTTGNAGGEWVFEPEDSVVSEAGTGVEVFGSYERDGDYRAVVGPFFGATLADRHSVDGWGGVRRQRQSDVLVDGWYAGSGYRADLARWLSLNALAEGGRLLDYGALAPAHSLMVNVEPSLRPTVSTRVDLRLVQQWFAPESDALSIARAARVRATWQFTQALGMRAVGELSQSDSEATFGATSTAEWTADSSLMLAWLRNPGTEGYIGLNQAWEPDGDGLESLTVFAKLSWLVRP